jgi:hypothetical protein
LLHGHTHAPARYRWPDPANTPRKSGACSAISHRQTCEPLTCSPAVPSEPGLQTGGHLLCVPYSQRPAYCRAP